uniref:Serine protease inhibitor n=1 Tax=Steinernema carpocapsae TaxID=34508 RepID=E2IPQ8_STECR|nr:serine protease inhibitor precursor [Steinernema carpocapsae]
MFGSVQIVILVTLLGIFASVSANKCGKNEIWMECASCEASCQYPSPICSMECEQAKCLCPQGAVDFRLCPTPRRQLRAQV